MGAMLELTNPASPGGPVHGLAVSAEGRVMVIGAVSAVQVIDLGAPHG